MPKIRLNRCRWRLLGAGVCLLASCGQVIAEPAALETTAPETAVTEASSRFDSVETAEELPRLPAPEGAKAMPKPHLVWVNTRKGEVLVDGYVSLNEGLLEMFACPTGTKEHESVVAVYSSAQIVHAALLAVGAKVGHPVKWDPKFEPAAGTEIEIQVRWLDEDDKWQELPAQQWLKDLKTEKPMTHHWVFAGSGFWKDEETGQEYYQAEAGDLICVSNFSTATLDLPIESSQVNEGLMFAANTKKIPPVGTPVRLVLKPKLKKAKQPLPQNKNK